MPDSSTILLVDDEDSVQKLLRYPLEREGFRVVSARDGEEALRLFAAEPIDLVVLDIMLPKLDGLEVCKRLRAESSGPSSAPTTTSRSRSRSASSAAVCGLSCAGPAPHTAIVCPRSRSRPAAS